ncbi:MAG TPA: calcium-binding protein, partial [Burkholderiales bacterium]|nr:calcium-binding protein [Burkholderiales bacterium]
DGNDTVIGAAGDDGLDGGEGNDRLDGGEGNDNLYGSGGNDTLLAGTGQDNAYGGEGNDSVDGAAGNDNLYGEAGNDTLAGADGNDNLSGGDNNDRLDGGAGNDELNGDDDNDTLIGGAGNDQLNGNSGNDSLDAGAGDDFLNGGDGNDALLGGDGNDFIYGSNDADNIQGGAGNDYLDSGIFDGAADTLNGGAGDDEYWITGTEEGDVIAADTAGNDVVHTYGSFTLPTGIETLIFESGESAVGTGNASNNALIGNTGDDTLIGLAGNDVLFGEGGDDSMAGGAGNDWYSVDSFDDVVDETVSGSSGTTDTVFSNISSVTLGANVENLTFADYRGVGDPLTYVTGTGNALGNFITGNGFGGVLMGGAGNDTLDDGGSDGLGDTLHGGTGNDRYIVTSEDTRVIELDPNPGQVGVLGKIDTVESTVSFALGNNVENLILVGSEGEMDGIGNELNNSITGHAGDDFLWGRAGNDTMSGGAGDDTYIVEQTGDVVNETVANGGNDTVMVFAAGAYSLNVAARLGVENLELRGLSGNGTGNALNNLIIGNSAGQTIDGGVGNDTLRGMSGDDTLVGGAGDDELNGGRGNDSMAGGAGNDTYHVNAANDVISGEATAGGIDTEISSVSETLDGGVENLELIGIAKNGTGNTSNNAISGNAQRNTLTGDAGNDTLSGNANRDTLLGGLGNDQLDGGSENDDLQGGDGNDLLLGDMGDDMLSGDAGNDTLNGEVGNDTMAGGAGNDSYTLDSTLDVISGEDSAGGTDTVTLLGFGPGPAYVMGEGIENLVLGAGTSVNPDGNELVNQITGNENNNFIYGFAGNDTLTGAAGNDYLDGMDDNDNLAGGEGDDTLLGGDGNDALAGDAGNDLLDGGVGNDSMNGGAGDDTYFLDRVTGDTVTEALNGGTDTVQLFLENGPSNPYTLGANFENLEMVIGAGTVAIKLVGNGLDNQITGDDGNNTLDGAAGNDGLFASAGDDSLIGGAGDDWLEGAAGSDTMTGDAGDDALYGQDQADSMLGGAGNDTLDGGTDNDTMFGGDGNDDFWASNGDDSMSGEAGNDTLNGGTGNDTMSGGAGNDSYFVDSADDVIMGETSASGGADSIVMSGSFDFIMNDTAPGGALNFIENLTINQFESGLTFEGNGRANDISFDASSGLSLDAGEGNDTVTGNGFLQNDLSGQNYTLTGGGGTDVLDVALASGEGFSNVLASQFEEIHIEVAGTEASWNASAAQMHLSDSSVAPTMLDLFDQSIGTVYTLENFNDATLFLDFTSEGALNVVSGANVNAAIVASGVTADLTIDAEAAGSLDVSAVQGEGTPSDVMLNLGDFAYTLGIADGQQVSVENYEGNTLVLEAEDLSSNNTLIVDNVAAPLVLVNGFEGSFNTLTIDASGSDNELDVIGAVNTLELLGSPSDSLILRLNSGGATTVDAGEFGGDLTLFNNSGEGMSLTAGSGNDWINGQAGSSDVLDYDPLVFTESLLDTNDVIQDDYEGDGDQLTANISGLGIGGTDLSGTGEGDLNILGIETITFVVNDGFGDESLDGGVDAFVHGAGIEGVQTIYILGDGQFVLDDIGGDITVNADEMGLGGSVTITGATGEGSTFIGSSGDDLILIGAASGGWDEINGNGGNDTLAGGGGSDDFVFNTALDGEGNVDRIVDFESGQDQLLLDGFGAFSAFSFLSGQGVSTDNVLLFDSEGVGTPPADNSGDIDDYLKYDTSTGKLYYDGDGNGIGVPGPVQFAVLLADGSPVELNLTGGADSDIFIMGV